jgi:hypothetical protein
LTLRDETREDLWEASSCVLALAGHSPDDLDPHRRVGALLLAEALHIHRVVNTKKA